MFFTAFRIILNGEMNVKSIFRPLNPINRHVIHKNSHFEAITKYLYTNRTVCTYIIKHLHIKTRTDTY